MEKITKSSDTVLIDPNEPLILPDGTALVGRVEWFLYALCCLDYQNLPTPMSRIEEFANALITGEIPNIEPQSRAEQFFLAILDGNVSNLPQPQSRSEVLLDKLARGEFDLSDVEPIQSSYELLLAYLIKNGGIDNIDYVLYEFSEAMKTMYNTVEKPFKSLELSGNTLVNCVLEDTENDDYTSFDKDYSGTSFTINGTSEGAIKSAILKGQTLVNLVDLSRWGEQEKITLTANGTAKRIELGTDLPIKPNTKYLTIIPIYENTINNNFTLGGWDYYTDQPRITVADGTGIIKIIKTTKDVFSGNHFYLELWQENTSGQITFGKPMLIEYQEGMENWDIPYFEGMQSVQMPVLKATGKNLLDPQTFIPLDKEEEYVRYEDGYVVANFTKANTHFFYKIDLTKFPKGMYTLIAKHEGQDSYLGTQLVFKDGRKLWGQNQFNNDGSHTEFGLYIQSTVGQPSLKVKVKVMLIIGKDTSAPFEPYKSNILSCNEEVTLRSIKNIVDELDCKTGEVTERIGEVTFKGALNEEWGQFDNSAIQEKTCLFAYYGGLPSSPSENLEMICDKFIIAKDGYLALLNTDEETVHVYTDRAVYFRVLKSKLSTQNVIGFKEWLSQNPFTIQYQLKTESIKTVDLNVVDQNNTKTDKIHVFNETTHVNASSDELTPTVNIGKSVSYPTIIKPNTKYTVDLKRNDKPLTVNLGGTEVTFIDGETRKTITTPSTLTNDKLSYCGVGAKCNEIMLIEGEVEGNVDYFTGMQSVKNYQTLTNTVTRVINNYSWTTSDNVTFTSDGSSFSFINYECALKPNTKYLISFEYDYVSSSNLGIQVGFRTDLGTWDNYITTNVKGTYKGTMVTGTASNNLSVIIMNGQTLTSASFGKLMVIEYQDGMENWSLPYFEGMQSVKMPTLSTKNNLFDGRMEIGGYNIETGTEENKYTTRIRCVDFIPINNPSNVVMEIINSERKDDIWIIQYDSNKNCLGRTYSFNIPRGVCKQKLNLNNNCAFIKFYEVGVNSLDSGIRYVVSDKTSILSCNDDVTLRGIGDVQDTLDCLTGEVTQRVEEIVLDGSENWVLNRTNENHVLWQTTMQKPAYNTSVRKDNMMSDKLIVEDFAGFDAKGYEFISINNGSSKTLYLKLEKTKAINITDLKMWLSQNPITVQYQLAESTIKTVDLNVVDQDGNTIPKIKSYNGVTHLEVTVPKQSLLPNVSAEVATDNSKDMSSLTTKHQEISETQSAIQDNIQFQSDEIDTALMATTEIFESILE